MRTHTTPRRLRAVIALVASAALAGGLAAAAPATASATATSTVFTPAVTSLSAAEQSNPLRGEYRWIGTQSPLGLDDPDVYDRDRTYWGRLEPSKGSYDFTWIENGLADAGSKKSKFGFRVMAYCPGCWMEQSWRNLPPITPGYVPVDANDVPRWNNETFLSGWEKLWATLGAKYRNDKRLGYIDIGGFGTYGEWMPAGDTITEASAKRIISAVATAFPTKHVVLSTVLSYPVSGIAGGRAPYILKWALDTYPNMGMRSDCLGNPLMQKPEKTAAGDMTSMWKTRPFFTEWCTNGDPTLGRQQVQDYHVSTISSGNLRLAPSQMTTTQLTDYKTLIKKSGYRYAVSRLELSPITPGSSFRVDLTLRNDGVAPTYDPWTVRLVLHDSSGARVGAMPLDVDLRTVLPGTTPTFTRYVTAPNVAQGTYLASLEVVDPAAYSYPMALANGSRAQDGSYPMGTVLVGQDPGDVVRVGGADRYAVSAALSARTFAAGVPVVYIATGEKFPDALSGGPAGGSKGGPVLLVKQNAIPDDVLTELTRLKPKSIVILGGSVTVSDAVKAQLAAYTTGSVTRLGGADRYAVSAALSARTFAAGVPVAYVATGEKFPDALSGGPAGGSKGGPVLLVHQNTIPDEVAAELTRLAPKSIVVLGGSVTVSDAVKAQLAAYTTGSVTRLGGADRYAVSAALSARTFAAGVPVAYVATGEKFPDALSGGPAGGTEGGPVLLVKQNAIPDSVAAELTRLKPATIVILGGSVTVSSQVQFQLQGYAQG